MSNKEPQNQDKTKDEADVEKRRRFIKGAGAAAPVILTLTSPSVFGQALCLSQQMSGNTSGHPAGGSCVKGKPPSYWKTPSNEVRALWATADFDYGTRIKKPVNDGTLCSHYSGGTNFNAPKAFGSGSGSNKAMRKILCEGTETNNIAWIAALLNSLAVPNYILSKQQVIDLKNGAAPPQPFTNNVNGRISFLITTW